VVARCAASALRGGISEHLFVYRPRFLNVCFSTLRKHHLPRPAFAAICALNSSNPPLGRSTRIKTMRIIASRAIATAAAAVVALSTVSLQPAAASGRHGDAAAAAAVIGMFGTIAGIIAAEQYRNDYAAAPVYGAPVYGGPVYAAPVYRGSGRGHRQWRHDEWRHDGRHHR
jgi:hypothetical protein